MTTTIAVSGPAIRVSKASLFIGGPFVAEKEVAVLLGDVVEAEPADRRGCRCHRDRKRVAPHHGGDGETQLVEQIVGHELTEKVRASFAENDPVSVGSEPAERLAEID